VFLLGKIDDDTAVDDLKDQVGKKCEQSLRTWYGHHPENAKALGKSDSAVKKSYFGMRKSELVK